MVKFYQEYEHVLDSESLQRRFDTLLNRPLATLSEIESWLLEQSVLLEEILETVIGHYIEFQVDTNDEVKKQRMLDDELIVVPLMKKYTSLFDSKLLDHPLVSGLDPVKYNEYLRRKRNAVALFREENLEREKEIAKACTAYTQRNANLTVNWEGEALSTHQIQRFLGVESRDIREQAWIAIQNAQLESAQEFEEIFDSMFSLRNQIALHAGFENYREYAFQKLERFEYGPEDCIRLAELIRRHVVPIKVELDERHRFQLGVSSYRPWDTSVPVGKSRLRPFETSSQLVDKVRQVFKRIDPEIEDLMRNMQFNQFLDLEARSGKAPGAFALPMLRSGHSYFVMNSTGHFSDVRTFIHEMGHCFHNQLMKHQSPALYRQPQMEIAEFASMTMEYLSLEHWVEIYPNHIDFLRAKQAQLEGFIMYLSTGIVTDLFQQWLYQNPVHSHAERNAKYVEMASSFYAKSIDYSGLEHYLPNRWRTSQHIFHSPFYSIEYIIANTAAVEMYRQYKLNSKDTVERYKHALSLGSSRPMTEVYEAAGVSLHISENTLTTLVQFVQAELAHLSKEIENIEQHSEIAIES